jgi:hypothetical protein
VKVSDLADLYLAALSTPTEETLAALEPVLADDVRAGGMFGSGEGKEAVLASTATPPYPLLGSATWTEPEMDRETITVEGTFPPGLPVSGITVTMRVADGMLVELAQELHLAPPPATTPIAIDDDIATLIDGALENKTPVIAGYVDADGVPHVSPRGTVQVWSPTELAMWARDPDGGMLRAIPTNPNVSLFYRDPATRAAYELTGRMRVTDDPEERRRIFDRSPLVERNFDPRRRGKAIIVELDSVTGSGPTGRVNMKRDA